MYYILWQMRTTYHMECGERQIWLLDFYFCWISFDACNKMRQMMTVFAADSAFKRGTAAAASRAQIARWMVCVMGTARQSLCFFSTRLMFNINNVSCLSHKWMLISRDPGIDLQFLPPNLPGHHNLTTYWFHDMSRCRSSTCGPFTCDPSEDGFSQDKELCFRDFCPSTPLHIAPRRTNWLYGVMSPTFISIRNGLKSPRTEFIHHFGNVWICSVLRCNTANFFFWKVLRSF